MLYDHGKNESLFILFLFLLDINECDANNGGCDQTCVNNYGSFECKCNDGFVLEDDKKSCSGKCLHVEYVIMFM